LAQLIIFLFTPLYRLNRGKGKKEDYNVKDFRTAGDGKTNDAAAIQQAIDQYSQAGGRLVIIPAGMTCLSGTLVMKSNVEFHAGRGSVVVASPNIQDYSNVHTAFHTALFIANENVDNIAFTGGTTIDGESDSLLNRRSPMSI
jgi:polygalacturonase